MALREWKTKIWAKKEVAKAKIKGAQVIIAGEHHFSRENTAREFHLIKEFSPTLLALEELPEGRPPSEGIRKIARNLKYLEKELKAINHPNYRFPGFERAMNDNRQKHAENLIKLARELQRRVKNARDRETIQKTMRRANAAILAAEILIGMENPEQYHIIRDAIFHGKRPVVGIDSDELKEAQIAAVRDKDMKTFKKLNVRRNETMAKKIAELVKRGHTPLAIVGDAHAEEIARILEEKHGIKAHVVHLPNPLEEAKTIEDLLRRLEEVERYQRGVVGDA